jgi:hypothetical protein
MRGISWLAAKTGQFLKKDSAPWSKYVVLDGIYKYTAHLVQITPEYELAHLSIKQGVQCETHFFLSPLNYFSFLFCPCN